MILGPNTLNKLIRNGLIKGLPDNYQASGMGVDLRCDQLCHHYGNANLDKIHRKTGTTIPVGASRDLKRYRIKPGSYYLAKTIETSRRYTGMAGWIRGGSRE